ncbi:hypothetical protein [Pontibacillus sp. ALD_SL1]|uniref:hypothetical protein n=1 Tax=Pontibacillus sp. ALD_SL1 TaxID=2777185 RepID=UPI001F61E073|nr:hypothetical protein [Pontibacillus sp. ALD_SL1]
MKKRSKKNPSTNYHHMYSLCNQHMNQYVLAELVDGQNIDGIVTGVDGDYVYLAIPLSGSDTLEDGSPQPVSEPNQRQYGYGPPYAGGYGTGAPYGYGYTPPPRFRRLILPLAALVAISALPWY